MNNMNLDKKLSVCGVLALLRKSFPDLNITTATTPFVGSGVRNVAINIGALNKMAEDSKEMLKYTAYLLDLRDNAHSYECDSALTAHGSIIDADGNLSSWSISIAEERKAERRSIVHFPNMSSMISAKTQFAV